MFGSKRPHVACSSADCVVSTVVNFYERHHSEDRGLVPAVQFLPGHRQGDDGLLLKTADNGRMRGHSRPRLYGRGNSASNFRIRYADALHHLARRRGRADVVDHHVAATAQTAIIRTRDRRRDGRLRQFGVLRSETAAAIRGRR